MSTAFFPEIKVKLCCKSMEKQSKTLKVTCFLLYLVLQFLADGISPCFYSFSISRGKYYVKKALNFAI